MNIEEREREKYKKMWALSEYRQYSPGLSAAPIFLKYAEWSAEDTLLDVGCGTGRAGLALTYANLEVTLLDFCKEALEVVSLPFINMPIWNLLEQEKNWDWLFCVDVLEHIPPELVHKTLRAMYLVNNKGGLLQIATFPDSCGRLINDELHLSIHPVSWWKLLISSFWRIEVDLSTEAWARFIVTV